MHSRTRAMRERTRVSRSAHPSQASHALVLDGPERAPEGGVQPLERGLAMAQSESTHDVAVRTETTRTTVDTKQTGEGKPAVRTKVDTHRVVEHRVDDEGAPKQIQPDGR